MERDNGVGLTQLYVFDLRLQISGVRNEQILNFRQNELGLSAGVAGARYDRAGIKNTPYDAKKRRQVCLTETARADHH